MDLPSQRFVGLKNSRELLFKLFESVAVISDTALARIDLAHTNSAIASFKYQ